MKINTVLFLIVTLFTSSLLVGQNLQKIGTNPNAINPCSVLELESASKGLLLPRMNSNQMNAIGSPMAGLTVYCTDCINAKMMFYNGITWQSFTSVQGTLVPISAPTDVTANPSGSFSASVSFSDSNGANGVPITSYTATSSPGGYTVTGTSSPLTFSNLANGTPYTFTVTANNATGTSRASAASNTFVPFTSPDPPMITSISPGNYSITTYLDGNTSFNGGSLTTPSYTATASPSNTALPTQSATSSSSPIVITGLIDTDYTVTVKAANTAGESESSDPSSAIKPYAAPGPPTITSVTAGNKSAKIYVTPSSNLGGSYLYYPSSYTVTSQPGGITATNAVSPIQITGLTSGVSYTFTVVATNPIGNSIASDPSSAIIPFNFTAPTNVIADTPATDIVTIAFDPPTTNTGGNAITNYVAKLTSLETLVQSTTTSPFTYTGLTQGISRTFDVYAVDSLGNTSDIATSNIVTPYSVPGKPVITSVSAGGTMAAISFTQQYTGGRPITQYLVTVTPNNGGPSYDYICTNPVSPLILTGLTTGLGYSFAIKAYNIGGYSIPSSSSSIVTPLEFAAPQNISAFDNNLGATINFTPPTSTNYTITNYTVTSSPGNISQTGTSSPINVTGLTNGVSYTFTVVANTSNYIFSETSAASNAVIPHPVNGTASCASAVTAGYFIEVTSATTGKVWMDRNLGASTRGTTLQDNNAYGCLYQWGRGNDGHASMLWSGGSSGSPTNTTITNTLSSTDNPGSSVFIAVNTGNSDWRSPQNNNLWQGVSGINNPCPTGFRIPTSAEMSAELTSTPYNASRLFFTLAGRRGRITGTVATTEAGTGGYYWTSTVNGTKVNVQNITSTASSTTAEFRSWGNAVRCIKN